MSRLVPGQLPCPSQVSACPAEQHPGSGQIITSVDFSINIALQMLLKTVAGDSGVDLTEVDHR